MLADDTVEKMYTLAHHLHPDDGVAAAVTLEACERIAHMRRRHSRRTGQYRRRLPEACLPQYCVYLASDARERAQERPAPGQEPRYRPTFDDYLVRYIKFLIWQTMDRAVCYVAVALGCLLYGYRPHDIASLAPEIFDPHNIRRVKLQLMHQIQARFRHTKIFTGEHLTLHTRAPTAHERQLVHQSLALFTPWGSTHVSALISGRSLLETLFDGTSTHDEWARIHAIIDPTCGGLARLIGEYNETFPAGSYARLADPDEMLAIPSFVPL